MRKFIILTLSLFVVFLMFKNYLNYENFQRKMEKKIHKIVIHNLNNIEENLILKKIKIKEGQSFWKFSSTKLSDDLKQIKGIKSFSFRMQNDGILNIFIKEDVPHMVWKFSNKMKYLNEKGEILAFSKKKIRDLITIEGNIQPRVLAKFNKILNKHIELKKNVLKIYYTESIGWKLFLKDESCLYLPAQKIDKVLNVYKKIKKSLIYENFKYFDMRILERVYLNKDNKCLVS